MTLGALGLLLGIGIAILIYIAVSFLERDYYQRKHEIIAKKLERVEEAKRAEYSSAVHSVSDNDNLGRGKGRG